jgi:beta-glucosidase
VVQVYVEDPAGLPFVPYWRRMVGFTRVLLGAGASAQVTVAVQWTDLAMYDGDMELRVLPGNYTIFVGNSSTNTPIKISAVV